MMRTGFEAGHAQHTVTIVRELRRMGVNRTAVGFLTFAFGRATFVAVVSVAGRRADTLLRPQLSHREFGK